MTTTTERKVKPRKPSIAELNQKAASANILLKIDFLKKLIEYTKNLAPQDMDSVLAILPKSVRQFNAWESKVIPKTFCLELIDFTKNAPQTLRRDRSASAIVNSAIAAVAILKNSAYGRRTKLEKLVNIKKDLALSDQLRKIAEQELIKSRREVLRIENELVVLKAQVASDTREFTEKLENANQENISLRLEIKMLLENARKITPIKVNRL